MRLVTVSLLLLYVFSAGVRAEVSVPSIFGDHMVLQQEATLPVWGMAGPGEKVTVTVGDHKASATAAPDGKWRVDLPPFSNGAPPTKMTIAGNNTLTFQDVLIGDVWLASGQSNMWYNLGMAASCRQVPGQEDAQSRANDSQIRLFLVQEKTSLQPLFDVVAPFNWLVWDGINHMPSEGDHKARWLVSADHEAGNFSAVAFFFGQELRAHFKRPIGLIGSYWPGSPCEPWVSISGLKKSPPFQTYLEAHQKLVDNVPKLEPDYEKAYAAFIPQQKNYYDTQVGDMKAFSEAMNAWQAACKTAQAAGKPNPPQPPLPPQRGAPPTAPATPDGGMSMPGNLYNAMIAPLIPYAIKGVIWYQGESNSGAKAPEYRVLLPRLITDWREKWGEGNFPFLIVQISHNGYMSDSSTALVREAQLQTAQTLPKTGIAVTVDLPFDEGIHPCDKIDPARRLALVARHVAYGEDIAYSGPIYASMKVEGNAIRIGFTHAESGLMIGKNAYKATFGNQPVVPLPEDKLVGFTIAGADKKFVPANAKIDGSTVVVSAASVPNPVAVRFGWSDVVKDNLFNKDNLPASPFRTDTWTDFKLTPTAPPTVPPSFGMEVLNQP